MVIIMTSINLTGARVQGTFCHKSFTGTVLKTILTKTVNTEETVILHKVQFDKPHDVRGFFGASSKTKTGLVDNNFLQIIA